MSKLVEEWRDIVNYEGVYQVSDWGNVKSLDRYIETSNSVRFYKSRPTYQTIKENGYHIVALYNKGKKETFYVHKLVAEAFIPNPNNYTVADHIDGNNQNNYAWNLRWCTQKQNNNFEIYRSHQKNNHLKSKTTYQYTLEGVLVKVWPSTKEVERSLGFNNANISRCCLGKQATYKGYIWSYIPL